MNAIHNPVSPAVLYDAIIVGGGIVGLVLAYRLRSSGLRIAIAPSLLPIAERPRSYAISSSISHSVDTALNLL